jgi:hypothetical protein
MTQQLTKKMVDGGELPENASAIEYFDSLIAGGGELPENSGAIEYLESLAPVGPATFSDGSGDYGIWTSVESLGIGMTGVAAVRRKKRAA